MIRVTVQLTGTQGGNGYSNFYFGGSLTAADDAATAVGTFYDSLEALMNVSQVWTLDTTVEEVSAVTGQTTGSSGVTANSGSGLDAANRLPAASQGLMRWRTGVYVNGREVRGRTFLPSPCESHSTTAGVPESAYINTANTAALALISDSALAGGLVIWSRTNGVAHPVETANCWSQWAVLRSRRD